MSEEICRLQGKTDLGELTLILTPTQLILDPSSEFRTKLSQKLTDAKGDVAEAGRVAGWIARTALNFAGNYLEKVFQPHQLQDVDLHLSHDRIKVELSAHRQFDIGEVLVDPADAYIFETRFRQVRKALGE